MDNIIYFKSTHENWVKEWEGTKPNTVRFTDDWNFAKWEEFKKATHVQMIRKETGDTFYRKIVDKTTYKNLAIISWRHE